jgi:glycosyltransferase involved in cell wall biosynthesis
MSAVLPRVLMITGRADSGGGPEHVFQLSRQLLNDCDVFIAAPREEPFWERYASLVGETRVCEIPHRHFSWQALHRLIAWSRKQEIDILHSHGRAGGLYGRLASIYLRCPSIHTPNCPLSFGTWRAPFYWLGDLVLSWTTTHIIAVSGTEASSIRRQLFRNNGISTIFNGVELPDIRIDSLSFLKRPLRIVHVTRFVPQKNSEMVLDILDQLRSRGILEEFHLDIVGDGPGRRQLEVAAKNRRLDKHISFYGTQPSVGRFFLAGFCVLSTSRWEGLPIALLEALALGLPAIATDTPGNNDVVSSSVGRLFSIGDPAAAADHLAELRKSTRSWHDLSNAAVNLVREHFSVRRMAEDTLAIYMRPLGKRQAS